MRKCKQMAVEWSPLCRPDWPFFIGYWLNLKTTGLLHHHMGQFIYFSEQKGESELFSYKQSFDSVQWLSAVQWFNSTLSFSKVGSNLFDQKLNWVKF